MERIELSAANVNLSEIVRHVSRDGVCVELFEGPVALARIVPIDKPRSMMDLDRALHADRELEDDSESYARDVLAVGQSLGELDDPWES